MWRKEFLRKEISEIFTEITVANKCQAFKESNKWTADFHVSNADRKVNFE